MRRALLWVRVMILLLRPAPRRKRPPKPPKKRLEPWIELQQDSVVWVAYWFAARHLVRLVVPALLVFLPLGVLVAAALAVVADGSMVVTGTDFRLVGTPSRDVLVWSAAAMAVSAIGQALALPATVMLATGRLVDQDVTVSSAMRAALRRWPRAIVLALITGVVLAAAVAVAAVVLLRSESQVAGYGVLAVLALLAMPFLLAVAPLVLEDLSVGGAIARAYHLASGAFVASTLTLLSGVMLFPAAIAWAAERALAAVPGVAFPAVCTLTLMTVPFQATTIARLFLHRIALPGKREEFDAVVNRLPDDDPARARPVRVLAGLLLPGLLYAGAVQINPLSWPEIRESVVAKDQPEDLDIGPRDLRSVLPGPDGRLVIPLNTHARGSTRLLACLDGDCARVRVVTIEQNEILWRQSAIAQLPDGRLVMSAWAREEGAHEDDWRARLVLYLCDTSRCDPAPDGHPISEIVPRFGNLWSSDQYRTAALAVRPEGGLFVAQAHHAERPRDERDVILLTICEDTSCSRPRTKRVATVPSTSPNREGALAVAVDAEGRPLVMRHNIETGRIFVISCADAACGKAKVVEPEPGGSFGHGFGLGEVARAEMVLRPDGRPLIAYREAYSGRIKLLDCQIRDCSRSSTTDVSVSGGNEGPAIVLDQRGRALITYMDFGQDRLVVASCTSGRCTRTPITNVRVGDDPLAMMLDDHGQLIIARIEMGSEGWELVLTSLLTPLA